MKWTIYATRGGERRQFFGGTGSRLTRVLELRESVKVMREKGFTSIYPVRVK